MKKLAELDLQRNMLIRFTSDNGGTTESQEPLRSGMLLQFSHDISAVEDLL